MSTQTVNSNAPSKWILGPRQDLLLILASPLLIVPVVMVSERLFSSASVYLFVASFLALGHHLPGMMRAYGDRALFQRFKLRFLLAPVFLFAVCLWFTFHAKPALLLVVFGWSMWHGLMQAFGFGRIYDSKVQSFAALTIWLDQALCVVWFSAAIIFSPRRIYWLLDHFYQSGGPALHGPFVSQLQLITGTLTALISILWVANLAWSFRQGRPASLIKVLSLVGTIAFFVYANVVVRDLLISVALFDAFHDIQYLAIVWFMNRRRVAAGTKVGSLTAFLFRPRAALVLLYVGLIFLYGSLNLLGPVDYVSGFLPPGAFKNVVGAFLAASALLHFYYDGFIWKVREEETQAALKIRGGQARRKAIMPSAGLPLWATHLTLWVLLFIAPLAVLARATTTQAMGDEARAVNLASQFPEDAMVQRNLAVAMSLRGEVEQALDANRHAAGLEPYSEAMALEINQALQASLLEAAESRLRKGETAAAATALREAQTKDTEVLDRFTRKGMDAAAESRHLEAIDRFHVVLEVDADHPHARFNLAISLASLERLEEARVHARRCVELLPQEAEPRRLLATIEQGIRRGR